MVQKARIELVGTDKNTLNAVCKAIVDISEQTGVNVRGPIPLPTKRVCVPLRKSPCGNGTNTYEHQELKLHKRLIDLDADERAMKLLMRIPVADDVHIEIELV